jgi:hypothetical protein
MFPEELKAYPQWVLWREAQKPDGEYTKVPVNPHDGTLAASNNPLTWSTFDIAFASSKRLICGIGFMLAESDPYAFIDLDDPRRIKKGRLIRSEDECSAIDLRQIKIFDTFDSYSERSPSGKGLHIIVKGSVPSGRRRDEVEVYSSLRFMTMTGDTFSDKPIAERNDLLRVLWEEIGGKNNDQTEIRESEQKYDDRDIYEQARQAVNGDKFLLLWNGDWISAGYSSQSEADFSLINMLGFYSRNVSQIKRLFYISALGQRDKAKRKNYIEKMIQRSFDNQPAFIDFAELDANLKKELDVKSNEHATPNPYLGPLFGNVPDPEYDYTTPPGLLGEIAQFIYESAPRQVKEIALAASIGLMAGICGRAYNVSSKGLNQYVLLLAKTGTGKETVASGIDKIMREVRVQCPSAVEFLGPSAIASGQAIIKHLAKQPCCVAIVGEFGLVMQSMCSEHADANKILLRKTLLELYMKSGSQDTLRATWYSDKRDDTPSVASPAFSILGESTPSTYYTGLDESMIAQGLLPRFMVIEYNGQRPQFNKKHASVKPSEAFITRVSELCENCHSLMAHGRVVEIQLDSDAEAFLDEYEKKTTDSINNSDLVLANELWNRASLKMVKLAALIAVGNNPYAPLVSLPDIKWAHDLVERDISAVFKRFDTGEIGRETGEGNQLHDLELLIRDYLIRPFDDHLRKYVVDPRMHGDRVISWSYLNRRITQKGSYRNDRVGASFALRRSIEALLLDGSIREVRQVDMEKRYGRTSKGFGIVEINHFINRR